ncbi:MAG: hypothetical protein KIT87_15495 [Anaerolineae bacterium]|nr:hypothetical protein [Anaerolineae bacterium]
MSEAQEAFESAVRDAFKEMHGALGYNPRRALNMVNQYGAVDAARRLLYMPGETSQGLETLWEHHRLDLSIEALMLKPEFASLFTEDERALARKILKDHGDYRPPWDTLTD